MKLIRFTLSFGIVLALGVILNSKIGDIPPMGKFFSPFHGFWKNAENNVIDIQSNSFSSGLIDKVDIHYDELLIPHVFAQNEKDLFFTQGYITAYHRLWQMEFQIYAAAGRLAEIVGEKINHTSVVELDRGMRRIGLMNSAKNSEEFLMKEEPEMYERIKQYSEGINAYINTLSYADYPIEYKLLDYKPEEWTPLKCFLLIANMNNILSRGERDLEHTNALKKWGRDVFEILYPERPDTIDPVIPLNTIFDFDPIQVAKPLETFHLEFTAPIISQPNPNNGSNSFVVNGEKTANGKVILANEPDLNLSLPSIWYLIHLNAPTINVMGASLPGSLGVVIGYNDSIAWGNTNAKRDLVDWYHIQFKNADRDEYLYNDKWVATKKIIEEIKVKGSASYYDTVIYTHHGPVVYDRNFNGSRSEITNLAMKWVAHDEKTKEFQSLYLVNKSKNYTDFVKAFRDFGSPPQNYSFASVNGDIALRINGKFPVKWEEQGKFLMDGNKTTHEWATYMPQSHHLQVKNPPQNFVSSANQHAAGKNYPYYQYDYNYEHYRGRRINDRLQIMNAIEVEDVMDLQHDNFNYNAFEALDMLLDSLDSTSFTTLEWTYYNELSNWDYFNNPEMEAPTIYEVWWKQLNDKLWDEIDSSEVTVYRPNWFNTVNILKNKPLFFMIDNQNTQRRESAGDLYRITFKETINILEKYLAKEETNSLSWHHYKNTTIRHLLKIAPFGKERVKIGGNKSIVNAASATHGPSWRMIVELGKGEINAWGIYPGSQTGNPGNPMYGHMIEGWASGTYHKMLFDKSIDENNEQIIYSIKLEPTKQNR